MSAAVQITSDLCTAYVQIRDIQVVFQNGTSRLSPSTFAAVAAHDSNTSLEIELASLSQADKDTCANALRRELARTIDGSKPRKLTFAQVQRIYGRAVD